jgi:hypothetical protein
MKLKIDIECTPIEARKLLGLPDIEPMQKAMMKQMEEKMASAMTIMDPEALARQWGPIGLQSLEQFQKLMWGAARAAVQEGPSRRGKPEPADKE